MTTKVHGFHPWDEISLLSKLPGPRHAAIAFVGVNAPEMLSLETGDVLVCNASRSAIESGATNPYVLREFVDRGVEVYSCSSLHAKVLAVRGYAIVGSANASRHSDLSLEAVVSSDEPEFVERVIKLVDDSCSKNDFAVDIEYLNAAEGWFQTDVGNKPAIVGVTASPEVGNMFVPDSGGTYWLSAERDDLYPGNAEKLADRMMGSQVAKRWKANFALDTMYENRSTQVSTGDVLILMHESGEGEYTHVWEPAKVVDVRPVANSDHEVVLLLQYNQDFEEHSFEDIDAAAVTIQRFTTIDIDAESTRFPLRLTEFQGRDLVNALWPRQNLEAQPSSA